MAMIQHGKAVSGILFGVLIATLLLALGGCQSPRLAASSSKCDSGDVDVQITVTKTDDSPLTCEIDVNPDTAAKCLDPGSEKSCFRVKRNKWVRWRASDDAGRPVNFELMFSPFKNTQAESGEGCVRKMIVKPKKAKKEPDSNDLPIIEYKYTVLITDGVCSGEFVDPRVRVEE